MVGAIVLRLEWLTNSVVPNKHMSARREVSVDMTVPERRARRGWAKLLHMSLELRDIVYRLH